MRNSLYMLQPWGQTVHKICTTCAATVGLSTHPNVAQVGGVHKPSNNTLGYTKVVPGLMHCLISYFIPVITRVVPTIHSTYKESDKSKIFNSLFLYILPVNAQQTT